MLTAGEAGAIREASIATPTECLDEPYLGHPIKCPEGVADGTEIPVVRGLGCETAAPDEVDRAIEDFARRERALVAVYEEVAGEPYHAWVPPGTHVVVIAHPTVGFASAWHVIPDGIVGIRFGCGTTAEAFLDGIEADRLLVGPLE
ncbi:MAG: hypothetical protein Kow0010_10010 [Dehalococcoidia bacterium]